MLFSPQRTRGNHIILSLGGVLLGTGLYMALFGFASFHEKGGKPAPNPTTDDGIPVVSGPSPRPPDTARPATHAEAENGDASIERIPVSDSIIDLLMEVESLTENARKQLLISHTKASIDSPLPSPPPFAADIKRWLEEYAFFLNVPEYAPSLADGLFYLVGKAKVYKNDADAYDVFADQKFLDFEQTLRQAITKALSTPSKATIYSSDSDDAVTASSGPLSADAALSPEEIRQEFTALLTKKMAELRSDPLWPIFKREDDVEWKMHIDSYIVVMQHEWARESDENLWRNTVIPRWVAATLMDLFANYVRKDAVEVGFSFQIKDGRWPFLFLMSTKEVPDS